MIIEFSNTIEPKNHSVMAVAIVITSLALFFVPTTLIILGYYASQPTGSLVSPLPQGTLSQSTPTPTLSPSPTSAPVVNPQPIIAAPNESTPSSDIDSSSGNNIIDKSVTIEAGTTETTITDSDVAANSQIFLTPRSGDKGIYSIRSKTQGSFVISVQDTSDTVRYIDYHIVNP